MTNINHQQQEPAMTGDPQPEQPQDSQDPAGAAPHAAPDDLARAQAGIPQLPPSVPTQPLQLFSSEAEIAAARDAARQETQEDSSKPAIALPPVQPGLQCNPLVTSSFPGQPVPNAPSGALVIDYCGTCTVDRHMR
ncbi:hypothetical protein K474DRAFT_1669507 [Panus rudis PR-1116 ss-1]|nr:hypothetical protein K474DRAFT_1669507 [Panus rudis PR-1116 ss-1]